MEYRDEPTWLAAGAELGASGRANAFAIGDWYNDQPRAKAGGIIAVDDAPRKAAEATGLSAKVVIRLAEIARKTPNSHRYEFVPTEVYHVIRNEPPVRQAALAKRFSEEHTTVKAAREIVTGKTAAQHKAETEAKALRARRAAGIREPNAEYDPTDYEKLAERTRANAKLAKTIAIQAEGSPVKAALGIIRDCTASNLAQCEPDRLKQYADEWKPNIITALDNLIQSAITLKEKLS